MKIENIMTKKVVSVGPEDTFGNVLEKLSEKGITGMPVVSKGRIVGIVTQSDMIKSIDMFSQINDTSDLGAIKKMLGGKDVSKDRVKKIHGRKVRNFMSRKVVTVSAGSTLLEAAKLISDHNIDRLPVMRSGRLVGIVTKKDIIRAMEKM
jgi:CBS domain-containing protein